MHHKISKGPEKHYSTSTKQSKQEWKNPEPKLKLRIKKKREREIRQLNSSFYPIQIENNNERGKMKANSKILKKN